MPVIQALPRIEGIMAFLSPTVVSVTIAQSKRESIIERPRLYFAVQVRKIKQVHQLYAQRTL